MNATDQQEAVVIMDEREASKNPAFSADVRAARWAVSLCEPLIPTRQRIAIDEAMITLVLEQPTWAAAWFSGILSDHLCTLPAEDPWRNLSVNLGKEFDKEPAELSISNQGRWEDLGEDFNEYIENPVRLPHGESFGSIASWSDLIITDTSERGIDASMAALEEDISEEAQIMIAFAANGWRKTFDYSRTLFAQRSQTDRLAAAINLFEAGSDAVRWAIHRRRVYTGMDDGMSVLSMFVWITNADFITAGKVWPEADNRKFIADEKLDDGLWEMITNSNTLDKWPTTKPQQD
jgi:hypothetical protein